MKTVEWCFVRSSICYAVSSLEQLHQRQPIYTSLPKKKGVEGEDTGGMERDLNTIKFCNRFFLLNLDRGVF